MSDLDVRADTLRITVYPLGIIEARDGRWWVARWNGWEAFLPMYDTTQKLFVRPAIYVTGNS